MTLKNFKICTLPENATVAVVPGGKITTDNMKEKLAGIDFDKNKERDM